MLHEFDADRDPIELLADEFAQRCRNGSCPSVSQYIVAYPELAEEIGELFPAIALMEQMGQQELAERSSSAPASRLDQQPIEQLGDYRIVREIGRGGMGVVYEAVQESLGRAVAVKVLSSNSVTSPTQLKRFQREAQAAAKLHHTNIVPIIGVGEHDGLHYYVMQYIDGQGLDQLLAAPAAGDPTDDGAPGQTQGGQTQGGQPQGKRAAPCETQRRAIHLRPAPDCRQIAEYGLQIARAVDYAHQHGVVHRDIKPANLLVDSQNTVWVTDFGLAKVLDEEELTQTGDLFGTLRYMAPEQFSGQSTRASDIYSIGVTLYELAARRPAFDERDARKLIHRITQHSLDRPRTINPAIPRDLETIILKAAAFDQCHRYGSAEELGDDLQHFLDGEPIAARRISLVRRFWRWSWRNPALSLLSGLSFLLLLLVAIVASVGYVHVDEARRDALTLAQKERAVARELRLANDNVRKESQRARAEFQRAEDNLRLAMSAFEGVIDRVSHRRLPESFDLEVDESTTVDNPPLITSADAELLQSLLQFYVEFAEANGANEAVQWQTAKAYHRIGDIRLQLGQFELAMAAHDAAVERYDRIAAESEPDLQLVLAAVDALNHRAIALARTSRVPEAIDAHLEARDRLLQQGDEVAQSREYRFALAETYNLLGSLWPRDNSVLSMLVPHLAAPELGPPGPDAPGPGAVRPGAGGRGPFARGRGRRGLNGRRANGPGRDASGSALRPGTPFWMEEHNRAAFDILSELIAEDPGNAEYRLALARCHRNSLASAWRENHRGEAAARLEESVRILEQLTADFPDNPQYAFELADVLSIDMAALRDTSFGACVEQRLQRAVSIAGKLSESSPNQPEYSVLYANSQHRLGLTLGQRGATDEAIAHLSAANRRFEALLEQFPTVLIYIASYARAANDLGACQRQAGQMEAARTTLENAILHYVALSYMDVDMRILRRCVATLQSNLTLAQ